MNIAIYIDGGARGNPGSAGCGLVIYDENKKNIFQNSVYLGIKTNNEAEYAGLINALEWVKNNKNNFDITFMNIHSDSQLLVHQINGLYKVKAPNLKPLFATCLNLLSEINLPYKFTDIRRELNSTADELANLAMDRKK